MAQKKNICFISHNRNVQEYITKQLTTYLGEYVNVKGISLEELSDNYMMEDFDLYLTSGYDLCEKVLDKDICEQKVLLADRALDTENIDKVFELENGTKALMVGNTYETALRGINLIRKIGIEYIELVPYYPGCDLSVTQDIRTAITTGSPHLVPEDIRKIIDLGVVGLDLSTYVELISRLKIPNELINNVSQNYIREIFDLSLRRQIVAHANFDIKKKLEVILDTISEAIISIDREGNINLINNWAGNLLSVDRSLYIDKPFNDLIPNIEIKDMLKNDSRLENEIKKIKGTDYVVSSNSIIDSSNNFAGVVISLKMVGEVQKIETKIRRELKVKNHIAKYKFQDIIGKSDEISNLIHLAKKFAKTNFTVLIEGESGTGKELLTQAIHNYSNRSLGPFVAINLAALPENLVESELFGYEEGAFTGAKKEGKRGLFEEAHNGTIFLDEIGDSSLEVQKKLLRVLEESEVRRVGGSTMIPINVRVIAATNKNLFEMVEKKMFRSDLYYRLCTISLSMPALKCRDKDIIELTYYLSLKFFKGERQIELSDKVTELFLSYSWPGNIRELENVVNYLCTMVTDNYVTIEHLPIYMQKIYGSDIMGNKDFKKSTFHNEDKTDIIKNCLEKTEQLEIAIKALQEINIASTMGRGVGRSYLMSQLMRNGVDCKDYQLRKLLNTLTSLGLIKQGLTKQGSKITEQGIKFIRNHYK
ncbi:MAG: putative sigma54 specific transcriptional regulator [Anaerocolumna sp.]|jgi:transcriptional regulator with PAS, ATPase and Fis domain|nr:putative sigma54 specific transcriptional regulator [Anaerocolumna sp.]